MGADFFVLVLLVLVLVLLLSVSLSLSLSFSLILSLPQALLCKEWGVGQWRRSNFHPQES